MRVIANDEQRSMRSANPCRPAGCGGTGPSAASGSLMVDGGSAVRRTTPARAGASPRIASGPMAQATRTAGLLPRGASASLALGEVSGTVR